MPGPATLLAAYDDQLRTAAETQAAVAVVAHGPLRLVTLAGGWGVVTYRDLAGADAAAIRRLVGESLEYFRAEEQITRVEWKTRGHDVAPDLLDLLVAHGFAPGEEESIMVGEAASLAVDVALPDQVRLRRVSDEPDVRATAAMQEDVFGDPESAHGAEDLLRRLALDDGMELWVAEAGGQIVSAGRLEPVSGTDFAGIWGGATRPEWRGRGIYRALTAARARSALRLGKRWIHSDSTAYSRPILERSGLVRVSTTTPYTWRR